MRMSCFAACARRRNARIKNAGKIGIFLYFNNNNIYFGQYLHITYKGVATVVEIKIWILADIIILLPKIDNKEILMTNYSNLSLITSDFRNVVMLSDQ